MAQILINAETGKQNNRAQDKSQRWAIVMKARWQPQVGKQKLVIGSKRLQLEEGGGATPCSLLDLESRDAISIPTAPTKPKETKAFLYAESAFRGILPRESANAVPQFHAALYEAFGAETQSAAGAIKKTRKVSAWSAPEHNHGAGTVPYCKRQHGRVATAIGLQSGPE
jgi:hypothetical protein